MIKIEKNCNK